MAERRAAPRHHAQRRINQRFLKRRPLRPWGGRGARTGNCVLPLSSWRTLGWSFMEPLYK